jgi:hypothetical protein
MTLVVSCTTWLRGGQVIFFDSLTTSWMNTTAPVTKFPDFFESAFLVFFGC